jgi:predicted transposase/invertase (TIGR01784 family)
MASPHDALFKYVFRQPEHTASELRAIFPSELSARLDWGTLQLEPSSFIDEALRQRHADLLFSVRCEGLPAYVYVLFEHQSTSDPLMAFRLLRYVVRIWDSVLSEHPDSKRLPAILPVVLYHGKRAWAAATELRELIDLDPPTMARMEPYQAQLRYILDDLSTADERALRDRALTAHAAVALGVLARARTKNALMGALRRWADKLAEMGRAPDGLEALIVIWEYALLVGKMDRKELRELAQSIGPIATKAYMTAAEKLRTEGEAVGLVTGRAEGKAEVVLRLLRRRVGEVPEAVRQRVLSASSDELDGFADRLITASTVEDVVGAEPEK